MLSNLLFDEQPALIQILSGTTLFIGFILYMMYFFKWSANEFRKVKKEISRRVYISGFTGMSLLIVDILLLNYVDWKDGLLLVVGVLLLPFLYSGIKGSSGRDGELFNIDIKVETQQKDKQ